MTSCDSWLRRRRRRPARTAGPPPPIMPRSLVRPAKTHTVIAGGLQISPQERAVQSCGATVLISSRQSSSADEVRAPAAQVSWVAYSKCHLYGRNYFLGGLQKLPIAPYTVHSPTSKRKRQKGSQESGLVGGHRRVAVCNLNTLPQASSFKRRLGILLASQDDSQAEASLPSSFHPPRQLNLEWPGSFSTAHRRGSHYSCPQLL